MCVCVCISSSHGAQIVVLFQGKRKYALLLYSSSLLPIFKHSIAGGILYLVDLVSLLVVVAMSDGVRTPLWGVARCDGRDFCAFVAASGRCVN